MIVEIVMTHGKAITFEENDKTFCEIVDSLMSNKNKYMPIICDKYCVNPDHIILIRKIDEESEK